jgi:serine/threonine protein kinase
MSDATTRCGLWIDASTLAELRVHARGLLRLRVDGVAADAEVAVHATWSGALLPAAAATGPGIVAIAVTPEVAGIHELAGELAAGERRTRFAGVHVRVGGDGPNVQVVHIDQSSARVVDNSRSSFGADRTGGLVGDGDWRPIELVEVAAAPPARAAAPLPRVDFAITTALATYQLADTLARGDIATVYGGHVSDDAGAPVAVKLADQPSDNDLLLHEARVLGLLVAEPHETAIHFTPVRDQFRAGDGRLGNVFDRVDGVDLTALRDRFRARGESGLPTGHVVWLLRRVLAALGRAHQLGILHGNLDPSHVLVRGRDHMVWVVDWCWAIVKPEQTHHGFKALNEAFGPPEAAARRPPTPASDLYALGKCAIHVLGGDPAAKTLPDSVDPRLARLIKFLCVESQAGRAQDAWQLYLELDRVRAQIWGPHRFVPLET